MSSRHRKHSDHDEHMDESWLIPYADLLTLMLALFIVLYATSSMDAKKFQDMSRAFNIAFNSGSGVLDHSAVIEDANMMTSEANVRRNNSGEDSANKREQNREALMRQEQEQLEELKRQLDQYIQSNGLATELKTKLNQSQLMITISDHALFASGSADIRADARALGVAIGTMLKNYPDYEIAVAGHTDNQPINTVEFASNYELSAKRAINFMSILIESGSLDPKRISPIGFGEYRPIDTNDTAAGRARNRRVEVSIIRKYSDDAGAQSLSVGGE